MEVQVRYTGKPPIVVNGKTWLQDEVFLVSKKQLNALVTAYGDSIVPLVPATGDDGAEAPAEGDSEQPTGTGAKSETSNAPVSEPAVALGGEAAPATEPAKAGATKKKAA